METCYHCGDPCSEVTLLKDDKPFCCIGCRTVYELLHENDLNYYYDLENSPGISPREFEGKYDFLGNEAIAEKLLEFNDGTIQIVSFLIPSIHCSSCIWVLENLNKLNSAVTASQVNFPEKTIRITYVSEALTLKNLVYLLSKIGYAPYISLEDSEKEEEQKDRSLIYKLGVAGFAFGNVMLLSFPEYFEVEEFWLDQFKYFFRWLMFAFSLPVVLYAASDYFVSAYRGLRSKILNIDVPIALGILVLFLRSTVEILFDWGTGFFDSLTGLVFFLLLGKFFQQRTYSYLSFERDYKSYFPIAVTRLRKNFDDTVVEEQAEVKDLGKSDRILIRNNELIPVDAILIKGNALIDYSFVTGEAEPVFLKSGDKIFAGGRQKAGLLEMEVLKPIAQSYLTQLWSHEIFSKKNNSSFRSITDLISKRFTVSIVTISVLAMLVWLVIDPSKAINVFTAVLIVACPCAIALAAPFTLGNLLRLFGKEHFYVKEAAVIEQMAHVDVVVFDKTGTLTTSKKNTVTYEGVALTDDEKALLTNSLRASNHPLSRSLYQLLEKHEINTLDDFQEETGKGITAALKNNRIKIGSYAFVGGKTSAKTENKINKTSVHISSNDAYKGCYIFQNQYREGVSEIFEALSKEKQLVVLSGDNDGEKNNLTAWLPEQTAMYFNQQPEDKLNFIKKLQQDRKKVMMIGDGLNDSGALKQSYVVIVVSENVNVFSPSCDAILDANRFKDLVSFLHLSTKGINIIKWSFVFSLVYNLIGLGFAVTGHLKPVVAAILMPLSSISIVVFTTVASQWAGKVLKNDSVQS